jgi:hypothetical protein
MPHQDLIGLAADKLLNGRDSSLSESFDSAGLGGVASIMCRLGIRPYASTPLAAQAVADFMAVLSYVSSDREQFFVSYSSDPILALGATKLWHSIARKAEAMNVSESNLSKYILPRLNVLLHQEVVDTGGIGEYVARIVLLLAMDACGVLETGDERMRWLGSGEFYSVPTFLQALAGTSVEVHKQKGVATTPVSKVRKQVETKWQDYFVSFTHFVQLSKEPTERCLWGLLGRRAAGILPRGHKGADLILPICRHDATPRKRKASSNSATPPTVSVILVQVKNHERGYSSFIKAVTEKLDPTVVFSTANSLHNIAEDNVLRVLLSLREPRPRHAYVEDARGPQSYALCIFGLEPWSSLPRKSTLTNPVEVVSLAVSNELKKVLGPWWQVAEMVSADLGKGFETNRESVEVIRAAAVKPLGDVLVLN